MSEGGVERLPPLYAKWAAELLGGAIPRESRATCDNCAMCSHDAPRLKAAPDVVLFNPSTKCCTYVPTLPNYLVGRILADTDPAAEFGRVTVETRIAEGVGVSPVGVVKPPEFSVLYNASTDAFGRARALRCPHYIEDGGRCGIWAHRYSVCATWFCKKVRGQVGDRFWNGMLELLGAVEVDLARWCVLELSIGDEAMSHLIGTSGWSDLAPEDVTAASLDRRADPAVQARLWGAWHGREREFYRRCAELVEPLSWPDVLGVCGPGVRAQAKLTRSAYEKLIATDIAPALTAGPLEIVWRRGGTMRVTTYNSYDPLDIPEVLFETLRYFDGRPTADALTSITEETGVRLETDLVRKLSDFGLLVPADTKP